MGRKATYEIANALLSARRRSAEEYVAEDWAAVARAIRQRSAELGLKQRDLIERSQLSKAVVGELSRNAAPRRRSARTLESLSTALDWHPQHLSAVVAGREPPTVGEPVYRPGDVPARLAAIERQLREITDRLDELRTIREQFDEVRAITGRLDDINANLATMAEVVLPNRNRVSR